MIPANLLADTLARALCVAAGADPVAADVIGMPHSQPAVAVEAWVRYRPRALLVVEALRGEIGAGGVAFVESALALVSAAAKVGVSSR